MMLAAEQTRAAAIAGKQQGPAGITDRRFLQHLPKIEVGCLFVTHLKLNRLASPHEIGDGN